MPPTQLENPRDIVALYDLAHEASLELGFRLYQHAQTLTGTQRENALAAHAATYKLSNLLPLGDDERAREELIRLRREWLAEAQRIKTLHQ